MATLGHEPYSTLWFQFFQRGDWDGPASGRPLTPEELAEIKSILSGVLEHRAHPEGSSLVSRFVQGMPKGNWLNTQAMELAQGLLECLDPYQAYSPYTNPASIMEGIWDHFKGGVYLKSGQGSWASGNNEPVVEYISMIYGSKHYRLVDQWCEVVQWPDGKYRSRFVYRGPDLHTPAPAYKVPSPA
jgi:hypothetical protein